MAESANAIPTIRWSIETMVDPTRRTVDTPQGVASCPFRAYGDFRVALGGSSPQGR